MDTIKINFKGGIIPHADLYNILLAAGKSGLLFVRFGLRQQLLLDVILQQLDEVTAELNMLGITYEVNENEFPNIMSSYPAEE
ncbi:MAG: rubredoxin, partial [Ginsengibacter sp.]